MWPGLLLQEPKIVKINPSANFKPFMACAAGDEADRTVHYLDEKVTEIRSCEPHQLIQFDFEAPKKSWLLLWRRTANLRGMRLLMSRCFVLTDAHFALHFFRTSPRQSWVMTSHWESYQEVRCLIPWKGPCKKTAAVTTSVGTLVETKSKNVQRREHCSETDHPVSEGY